jgi:polyisoprenoid-binding protein YceI
MRTSLFVLAALALGACPDKDKPAPTAPATVQRLDPVPALANATSFAFSHEGSKVEFVGAKISGKHPGGFKRFQGAVDVVEKDLSKSRVRVDIELVSVFTDSEKLAGHLRSADFFGVDTMPTARFVSTSIALQGDAATVTGELTLHGVTRPITFPAKIALTDDQLDATAQFTINRKQFGIVYPGKPDDLISDDVQISFEIHAKR